MNVTFKYRPYFSSCVQTAVSLLVCLSLSVIPGCGGSGGGTSGTGGGGFAISGVLRTAAGNVPVSGIQVSVSQTGAPVMRISALNAQNLAKSAPEDVTDEQGQFFLALDSKPDMLTLLFQGESYESTVQIPKIPGAAVELNLSLTLDEETNSVSEESEQFTDESGEEVHETEEEAGM